MDNWVNNVTNDLLDVPHFHVTLTTDDLLWPVFHTNRSLLKVLLKTASQAIHELVVDLYPGVRIGLVYTTHTFGRDLGFQPHVHLVMTKGGLKDGEWSEIDHLPAARLSARWRYLLCKHLRDARPYDHKLGKPLGKGIVTIAATRSTPIASIPKALMPQNTSALPWPSSTGHITPDRLRWSAGHLLVH